MQIVHGSQPHKRPVKITELPYNEIHSSIVSVTILKSQSSTLKNIQSEKLRQRIEKECDILQRSEADHCYFINSSCIRAREELERSADGSFNFRERIWEYVVFNGKI